MRPFFRSILLFQPSHTATSHLRQLHLASKWFTPACVRNTPPLIQPRRHQLSHQIRWSSSGNDSPRPSPLTPEFKNLPSQQESRRSDMAKKVSKAMEDLQIAAFTAGQKLNVLTGYSEIESLKKSIEQLEDAVKKSRSAVLTAKEDYQSAIARRSASQREVNELLQRKHAWSPSDLERFTELYRSDHANEQAEAAAQESLAVAERVADEVQTKLSRSILSRYHEEQIWSDKIRRASTWVTWGLMGFNVLLFVVVQLWLEPWKRRRLVGGFEEKVREVIQEEGLRNALLNLHVEPEAAPLVSMVEAATAPVEATTVEAITGAGTAGVVESEPVLLEEDVVHVTAGEAETAAEELAAEVAVEEDEEELLEGEVVKQVVRWAEYTSVWMDELFSEKEISLKHVEYTTAVLQSAALGAFVTALVSLVLSNR